MSTTLTNEAIVETPDDELKQRVADYWNSRTCQTRVATAPQYTKEFYEQIENFRAKDEPEIAVRQGEPPAKLVVRDLEVGKGAVAERGKALAVDYKGVRWDDGVVFDSTWDGGKPFQFLLGANQVIQGWEKGLAGMHVGGRRELIVPPDLAYGDHGQASIRPNDTLVFVVDLLDVR